MTDFPRNIDWDALSDSGAMLAFDELVLRWQVAYVTACEQRSREWIELFQELEHDIVRSLNEWQPPLFVN